MDVSLKQSVASPAHRKQATGVAQTCEQRRITKKTRSPFRLRRPTLGSAYVAEPLVVPTLWVGSSGSSSVSTGMLFVVQAFYETPCCSSSHVSFTVEGVRAERLGREDSVARSSKSEPLFGSPRRGFHCQRPPQGPPILFSKADRPLFGSLLFEGWEDGAASKALEAIAAFRNLGKSPNFCMQTTLPQY